MITSYNVEIIISINSTLIHSLFLKVKKHKNLTSVLCHISQFERIQGILKARAAFML